VDISDLNFFRIPIRHPRATRPLNIHTAVDRILKIDTVKRDADCSIMPSGITANLRPRLPTDHVTLPYLTHEVPYV
jgi:hypothetical protein